MFHKRRILVPHSLPEVSYLLRNQVRILFPYGSVSEDAFTIYQSVASTRRYSRIILFRFRGSFHACNGQTEVIYQVLPPVFIVALGSVLTVLLIHFIFQWIFASASVYFVALLVLFYIIFLAMIISQKNDCIRNFEKVFISRQ